MTSISRRSFLCCLQVDGPVNHEDRDLEGTSMILHSSQRGYIFQVVNSQNYAAAQGASSLIPNYLRSPQDQRNSFISNWM